MYKFKPGEIGCVGTTIIALVIAQRPNWHTIQRYFPDEGVLEDPFECLASAFDDAFAPATPLWCKLMGDPFNAKNRIQ